MTAWRERLDTTFGVLFGLMWLAAAVAKVASPFAAYQFMARAAPMGLPPKPLLAAAVAVEALLGALMCLRVVRGFGWSLAALAAASAAALSVRAELGGYALCGCFGALLGTSVDTALVRAAALAAVHAALIVATRRTAASAP